MSLIQEALDKVQEKRFGKGSVKAKSAAVPEPAAVITGNRPAEPVKKEVHFTVPVAGAAVAVAAIALVLIFVLFGSNLSGSAAKKAGPTRPRLEVRQNVIYKPITPVSEEKSDAASAAQAVMAPVIEAMAKTSSSGISSRMPKLILNGIMYVEGNPRAIVNGYTVLEGDSVSGAVVKEIRKDSVVFNANDVEITIDLK